MNYNSACPGLDLHFWRKICKNCKCGRDDHDVDDDEFPQFDLLFGPSGKFKKKTMHTTEELAVDYMKALPVEKLPIKGSAGAALRRQLLQKQLPLHDIDHKVCDELSEQEQKQFEKYLENIKKYVGQGKVMKMIAARPFDRSLMTPINATDMQHFSPQHKSYIPSTGVQLRTPSSFTVKNSYAKHPYEVQNKQDAMAINDNKISNAEGYNCSLTNVVANNNVAKSQLIEGKLINEHSQHASDIVSMNEKAIDSKVINLSIPTHLAEQEIVPAREMHTSENYIPYRGNTLKDALERHRETLDNITPCIAHLESVNSKAASIAEFMLADALLPPSAIHVNDIIGSTLDEKSLMFIREKLADKYNATENSAMHAVPKSSRLLDDTSDILRNSGSRENNNNPVNINEDAERTAIITAMKNPAEILLEKTEVNNFVNTPLEAERKMYKHPSQVIESIALSVRANHKPAKNNSSVIEESKTIQESAMDPLLNKYISVESTLPILNSSLQTGSQCPVNASLLQTELSSSILQPTVIHSEQLQKQVFPHIVGDSNEQLNTQHKDHLKDSIKNLKIDSKVYKCKKCYEDIRIGDVIVTAEKANNASWHPGCFVCSVCNELLVDLVYFYYKNKLYCGRDLAAFLGSVRCFACDELIFVREYTVAEEHNYHVKHFCC